jgi:RNA polymerase sigma-70 factor, ECF subfamily
VLQGLQPLTAKHAFAPGDCVIDWQAIVAEHGPSVWRTVLRLVSHREDALDCYQETFLQASNYAARQTVSNWAAFLRRTASARALDCLRKRYRVAGRVVPLAAAARVASHPAAASVIEIQESLEQLRRALAELPPQQSEVFCLREIELMSTAEVAALLNVTPDDVATWLHRAKRKLREGFAEDNRRSEVEQ